MAISEESRHHLYVRLEEVLGAEGAATLMEHLPPVGWADVATKRDVDGLGDALRREIEALATATKRDIEDLAVATRRDIEGLSITTKYGFDAVKREIAALASVMPTREDVATLRADVEHELRVLSVRFVTVLIATFSVLLAAITLATAVVKM